MCWGKVREVVFLAGGQDSPSTRRRRDGSFQAAGSTFLDFLSRIASYSVATGFTLRVLFIDKKRPEALLGHPVFLAGAGLEPATSGL